MKKRWILLALMLVCALALAACGKKKTTSGTSSEAMQQAVKCLYTNPEQAYDLLQKEADAGNTDALFLQGYIVDWLYVGAKQDPVGALKLYNSKKPVNAYAKLCVAILTESGMGTEYDPETADRLFTEAMKKIDESKLANSDYAGVLYQLLGMVYANGTGVEANQAKAYDYLKKAYELGNPWGAYYTAELYLNDSLKFLEAAATSSDAYTSLNEYRLNGWDYLTKADAMGLTIATSKMASMYMSGAYGTMQDTYQAFELANRAAELGDTIAKSQVATYYLYGTGVAADGEKAKDLFLEIGTATAYSNLAYMYRTGLGVEQNDTIADEYSTKANELGYAGFVLEVRTLKHINYQR